MSQWIAMARRARLALGAAVAVAAFAGAPAQAVTIKLNYDSSFSSLSYAPTIESDLNRVAQYYDTTFASPVTVNIGVGWGEVDGRALSSGALSSSYDNFYGYFSYSQIRSDLAATASKNPADTALASAVAHLPNGAPTGVGQYAIASAEAKVLGVIPGFLPGTDGYIGFSKSAAWDFSPTDGVSAGTYDFEAAAAHEIAEVLGRLSGLSSASPTYRMPLDLFRYSAPRQLGFSYSSPAYFSVDGGVTNLGAFSASGGGDRGDWASGGADAQTAFATPGVLYGLSTADLTVLDALGWGGSNIGDTQMLSPTAMAQSFMGAGVPEPSTWWLAMFGVGLVGAALRRRGIAAIA